MAKRWYVIHTYSGYEHKVKSTIEERIKKDGLEKYFEEILVPTEPDEERPIGKRGARRKFFPGYILIKMELPKKIWHFLKSIPNVTGFVGGNPQRPNPLPDEEAEKILTRMKEGTLKIIDRVVFEAGMPVKITDGPFVNFNGIIDEVRPEKQKLRVLVTIFGRQTPIELDFHEVEKV